MARLFDEGELALGQNLLVAYALGGYNYEDAVILSDRIVKKAFMIQYISKSSRWMFATLSSGRKSLHAISRMSARLA